MQHYDLKARAKGFALLFPQLGLQGKIGYEQKFRISNSKFQMFFIPQFAFHNPHKKGSAL